MNKELITQLEKWVEKRSYLKSIASLYLSIFKALDKSDIKTVSVDNLELFSADFEKGIPLFDNKNLKLFSKELVREVVSKIATISEDKALPTQAIDSTVGIAKLIEKDSEIIDNLIDYSILNKDEQKCKTIYDKLDKDDIDTELLEIYIWLAVRYILSADIKLINEWQQSKKSWDKNSCPTCGNEAVLAELRKGKRGRERKLICEHCGSLWSYKRIGCAYCDNTEPKELDIIEIEDEPDFRIDLCKKCNCYIKTYVGEEDSNIARFDFASLHLDYIPAEQRFNKNGNIMGK